MERYFVRIEVLGQIVWADTIAAEGPAHARELAERSFLTPLPESAYGGLSTEIAAAVRRSESHRAELRLLPRTFNVRRSRAAPQREAA